MLFFFLFGAWAFALDSLIDAGIKRIKTSHYGTINRLVSGEINADIVISGSSRALNHYDPLYLEQITDQSAYNLGQDGSHTDIQVTLLKLYLKNNKRPALVIHNLDMHSLQATEVIHDSAPLMPYLYDRDLFAAVKQIDSGAWKWRHLPLYGYATQDVRFDWLIGLGALLGLQPPENTIQGYHAEDQSWNSDFARFKAKHPNGVSYEIEPEGVRALEELISLCRTNDIPLLLVYSPQYHEMLKLVKNREYVFSSLQEIAARNDVPLWDYSKSELCRDTQFFYNSQHLNRRGATLFSRDLAHRLKSGRILVPNGAERERNDHAQALLAPAGEKHHL